MSNIKLLIEALSNNIGQTKTARDWSMLFIEEINKDVICPARPDSIFGWAQSTLKTLHHLGMVKAHRQEVGRKIIYKYESIKQIEFTE